MHKHIHLRIFYLSHSPLYFFAFGFDQVTHRTTGVEKRIRLSPVSKNTLLTVKYYPLYHHYKFRLSCSFMRLACLCMICSFNVLNFIMAYGFFIILNAVLLVIASAIYSFFNEMKSALGVLHRHFSSRHLYRWICTSN